MRGHCKGSGETTRSFPFDPSPRGAPLLLTSPSCGPAPFTPYLPRAAPRHSTSESLNALRSSQIYDNSHGTMPLSMREQLRDQSGSYSPRLLAVFFAVFDPTAGPTLAHQVPEGSVATALSTFPGQPTPPVPVPAVLEEGSGMVRSTSGQGLSSTQVLFDFSSILDFVIPKPELCGHLITKATRTCKILGLPVR